MKLPGVKALPVISNQKMNVYLKQMGELAELNDKLIISEKMADGKIVEKEFLLWELMSCHTSRKTFISYAVENGIAELDLKSLTGHSKHSRAFGRYYEVSIERKTKEMNKLFRKDS